MDSALFAYGAEKRYDHDRIVHESTVHKESTSREHDVGPPTRGRRREREHRLAHVPAGARVRTSRL